MKNLLSIFIILIVFLITYFLQVNLFAIFTIAGVKPNLFVILVLFIGLFTKGKLATGCGIAFGLLIDFFIGRTMGVSAIMLGVIGLLGWYFDKNFSKDARISIMLMVMGATFVYEFGTYLMNTLILASEFEFDLFIRIVAIEIVYNTLLTIILYPLLQKVGYTLENRYKEEQVLTRYFS